MQIENQTKARQGLALAALAATLTAALFYFWQRMYVSWRERYVRVDHLAPPEQIGLEDDATGDRPIQLIADGTGPIFHRRYRVDILNPQRTAEEVMAAIQTNLDDFCPPEFAIFEKTSGAEEVLAVGDNFQIHITGPWNGPVQVIDVTPTSFTFITLEDHLEAGEITFRLRPHPRKENVLRFEIMSWSRSRDMIIHFAYHTLGVLRMAQTSMWAHFCNAVAECSGGELEEPVVVLTEEAPFPEEDGRHPQAPLWEQYAEQLGLLQKQGANFDLDRTEEFTAANGWNIDEYWADLPGETPGEPLPNGPWAAAKRIIHDYKFPDPDILTGIYVPHEPLEGRTMLLAARFLFLKFYFGVKIRRVVDEVRQDEDGRPVRAWGYSYHTLDGHFEMGEILFEVVKYLDTGDVKFHIYAYSKTGSIRNLFYRIGFRLFGRRLQVKFARRAQERMQEMVAAYIQRHPEAAPMDTEP